jgi:hypothetical protein
MMLAEIKSEHRGTLDYIYPLLLSTLQGTIREQGSEMKIPVILALITSHVLHTVEDWIMHMCVIT